MLLPVSSDLRKPCLITGKSMSLYTKFYSVPEKYLDIYSFICVQLPVHKSSIVILINIKYYGGLLCFGSMPFRSLLDSSVARFGNPGLIRVTLICKKAI